MANSAKTFQCGFCGDAHEGLPKNFGYQMPDDLWALPEAERQSRGKISADLCRLDARHFIRCVLAVPLIDEPGETFGWGVWTEVSQETFFAYLEFFERDASKVPPFDGRLANAVPGHDDARGAAVLVHFREAKSLPALSFPLQATHSLARTQRSGMSASQNHDAVRKLQ